MKKEKEIKLDEVIKICRTIKSKNVEIDLDPYSRYKNVQFMEKYSLIPNDIVEIIRSLNKEDYYKGPIQDRNPNYPKPVWIFIKRKGKYKIKIYIKFKLLNSMRKIFVLSIHEEGLYDEN